MLYLALDSNQIRILSLKKSLMNQYRSSFFTKNYQTDLIKKGEIVNLDFIASAVKEALIALPDNQGKDKEVILILPQDCFLFLKSQVPKDMAASALSAFVKDKIKTELKVDIDDYIADYSLTGTQDKNYLSFFAIEKKLLLTYKNALELIDLKIINIVPETLAYYKLFEKALRPDKQEIISYVSYQKNQLKGYFYDTFGLLNKEAIFAELNEKKTIQTVLKNMADEYAKKDKKINRLILSGKESENIRQDTFTKAVGIWTNPLKRIIPNFYQDYLKMLVAQDQTLPILEADVCLGAFIFIRENKKFSLYKKGLFTKKIALKIPFKKELLVVLITAIISFLIFYFVSQLKIQPLNIKLPELAKTSKVTPTLVPTKTPSPTPTPAFKKADLKIKILNGTGITGKAGDTKKILTDDKYGEILTGNADKTDYEKTIIKTKKEYNAAYAMISSTLKEYVNNPQTDLLDDKEAADIIIIIGKDFK